MRLKRHVYGELTLALRGAVEADRTVEVLVADVVGGLGRGVARLRQGAGVELACPVGGADLGTDDALQVNLHRPLAEAFIERVC
jgi:hypothetical protein